MVAGALGDRLREKFKDFWTLQTVSSSFTGDRFSDGPGLGFAFKPLEILPRDGAINLDFPSLLLSTISLKFSLNKR